MKKKFKNHEDRKKNKWNTVVKEIEAKNNPIIFLCKSA